MGILNITPDSFFEGSRFYNCRRCAQQAAQMIADGAKIIDIGGYSSRPGADAVSPEEEWQRLERVIRAVCAVVDKHPVTFISVITFRASVAEKAVGAGAHMVNDISGGNLDERMGEIFIGFGFCTVISSCTCRAILHSHAAYPTYEHVTVGYRSICPAATKLPQLHAMGIHDTIVDSKGFWLRKDLGTQLPIVARTSRLSAFTSPILTGVSRKSMIYKALGTTADESLNGTTALHMAALLQGSNILRVHDVKEATLPLPCLTN